MTDCPLTWLRGVGFGLANSAPRRGPGHGAQLGAAKVETAEAPVEGVYLRGGTPDPWG